jgi:hypothetical protein
MLWLRSHTLFGFQPSSDAAAWIIPTSVAMFLKQFQVPMMFGLNVVVVSVVSWALAYMDSSTDAALRAHPGRWATLGNMANTVFHNPARWWLVTFGTLVGMVVGAGGIHLWLFTSTPRSEMAWGLSALFGSTLIAAMANPDNPDPLRAAAEVAPKPALNIPGESAETDDDGGSSTRLHFDEQVQQPRSFDEAQVSGQHDS